MLLPCPLCGKEVEITESPCPSWFDESGSTKLLKIHCREVCGVYEADGTLSEFADSLDEGEKAFVSRATRLLKDNDGWVIHTADGVKSLLQKRRFAATACVVRGLREVRLEHAGGFDGGNMLFIVDTREGRFTMRVHSSRTDVDALRSQLFWLTALRKEANLEVPEPVPAPDGSLFQPISLKDSDERRFCVLFRWMEGERFEYIPEEKRTPAMIENYGEFVARLHQQAESFIVPKWFRASRRDREGFRQQLESSFKEQWLELGKDLSESELAKYKEIGLKVLQTMDEMGEGSEVFGLCHNDIAAWNVLFHGDQPRLIDFQNWGYGYYLADMLRAMHLALKPSQYETFLRGYQCVRPLPERFAERSEIFMAGHRVSPHWF